MPDPKLLAFSILLGTVSLYLLFKAKRAQSSKKSTEEANESRVNSKERRAQLVEKAARVEKACKELDARFLDDLAEMKTLARQYKEQIQEGEEEGWKVKLKTRRDQKLKHVSDSPFTSDEDDRPRRKKSTSIYPGLRYEVVSTTGSGDKQQVEFTFSSIPATDVDEDDKKIRRKPLLKSIATVEDIITEYPKAPVKLLVHPPAHKGEEGSVRVSDLVKDTQYATSVYRQLMPRRLSANTAALLGHGFGTATEERDYAFFLSQLLNTLRPGTLVVSFLPSDRPDEPPEIDSERCLLPAKQMPLVLIGNKLFRNSKNVLDTLEIGPFIPVSQDSGSRYHFAFAEWCINTLVIRYEGATGSGEPSKTEGRKILPSILFDLTYGFVRMMSGSQGDEEVGGVSGTKIVLVVPDEAQVKRFRKTVEGLAKIRDGEEEDDNDFFNHASRLELFKRKLYYTVVGLPNDRPRTVWQI